jgi:hypothetical protein
VLPGYNCQVGAADTGAVDFDQDVVARCLGNRFIHYVNYILTLVADGFQQVFTSPACDQFIFPEAVSIELNKVMVVVADFGLIKATF